jgi:hypothetical protein
VLKLNADEISDLAGSPKGVLTELKKWAEDRRAYYETEREDTSDESEGFDIAIFELDEFLSKIGELKATLLEKALTEKEMEYLECWCQSSLQSGDQLTDGTYDEIRTILKKIQDFNKILGGKSG